MLRSGMQEGPSLVDRSFRVAYRAAHRLLRAYWTVTRPRKGGTLVAAWCGGELLLLKNTYRRLCSLPGGYPHPGETPEETGARELEEECGVQLSPSALRVVHRGEHLFEGRIDTVVIVETELGARPTLRLDWREIEWARFFSPEEATKLPLVPHLADYLAQRGHARR
jgi:8-oxo-dGTP pyrophosphatase MutT (NUDIX family)